MSNAQQPAPARPPLKDRLQGLLVEYGSVALWVYFIIFAIVLFGFALALRFGIKLQGLAGSAGIWAGAYVATKLTQPLRIIATVALTPAAAALSRRKKSASDNSE
jgi:hypothetical protein